jgi:ATP-dependent exoDNAse (exonuclease V) beta subunit
MSLGMIEAVKRLQTSPTQKLLLFVLADCHNEKTGRCNPSYRYLMEITGLSNKAVANNLKSLRDSGALFYDSRNGVNSYYSLTPDGYTLTIKPVNLVHRPTLKTSEPSSQDEKKQPVNLVPEPVNLVPQTSEPSSHKPVEPEEPELLLIADSQSPKVTPEIQKPKKTRKKKESIADPRHREFVEIFAQCYAEAFGEKWAMNGAKDGTSLSRLLKALPDLSPETWKEALEWCQEISTKPFSRAVVGHTGNLSAFCSNWSAIVAYSKTYQESK